MKIRACGSRIFISENLRERITLASDKLPKVYSSMTQYLHGLPNLRGLFWGVAAMMILEFIFGIYVGLPAYGKRHVLLDYASFEP